MALAGCASPPSPELITTLYVAHDLNAQAGTLTFETSTGHVVRMPADDPSQALIVSDTGCSGLRLDATSAYFFGPKHDDGTCDLLSASLAGGVPMTLAGSAGPGELAIGPTQIITNNGTQLFSLPISGGMPTPIGAPAPSDRVIVHLAIDGTRIYDTMHIRYERLDGWCEQRSLDGSVLTNLACPTDSDIAVVNGTFYFAQACIQDMLCGALYTFTLAGTQREIAHSDHGIYALHAHGKHLYWAESTRITRANLDGGDQTVLYEGSEIVNDLAVDDSDLYFATDMALYRTRN